MRALFVALALAIATSACSGGGSGPTSPSPPKPVVNPIPAQPVMAPPPVGVSPEVWRVAFMRGDAKLYRPDAVHLDVSSFDLDTQKVVAEMAAVATDVVGGKTSIDLVPGSIGATFTVMLTPGLVCGTQAASGCTGFLRDSAGHVIAGSMQFSSITVLQYKPALLHEIFRTLGINMSSPVPGIMAENGWSKPEPSNEERLMLLGRYEYPLLSRYSPQ